MLLKYRVTNFNALAVFENIIVGLLNEYLSVEIITRVPRAIQLAYLDGTTCALMKDLLGWLPSRPARFESIDRTSHVGKYTFVLTEK